MNTHFPALRATHGGLLRLRGVRCVLVNQCEFPYALRLTRSGLFSRFSCAVSVQVEERKHHGHQRKQKIDMLNTWQVAVPRSEGISHGIFGASDTDVARLKSRRRVHACAGKDNKYAVWRAQELMIPGILMCAVAMPGPFLQFMSSRNKVLMRLYQCLLYVGFSAYEAYRLKEFRRRLPEKREDVTHLFLPLTGQHVPVSIHICGPTWGATVLLVLGFHTLNTVRVCFEISWRYSDRTLPIKVVIFLGKTAHHYVLQTMYCGLESLAFSLMFLLWMLSSHLTAQVKDIPLLTSHTVALIREKYRRLCVVVEATARFLNCLLFLFFFRTAFDFMSSVIFYSIQDGRETKLWILAYEGLLTLINVFQNTAIAEMSGKLSLEMSTALYEVSKVPGHARSVQ
ncbi:hypothetical protein MRX96_034424 [Rhipicephalus microplus]